VRVTPTSGTDPQQRDGQAPAETIDAANGKPNNSGTHFHLALYLAQALPAQRKSAILQARFNKLAETLAANDDRIDPELNAAQR
jgi:monomeric isocitrate dehydrogenase